MNAPAYSRRIADRELESRLQRIGAVLIEGPKACGKTETARQLAASEVRLDVDAGARAALAVEPELVLAGKAPRLIDEWQVEPEVWNLVRRAAPAPGASRGCVCARCRWSSRVLATDRFRLPS